MAGYTRVDTSNNIADGNVISAADLDNEFDGIQAAFNASTGHNHDGTTGEGAPILVLGPTQDVVVGASTVTPKTTNTVDIGSSSLKFKDLYLAGNASIAGTLAVTGATTLSAALTYGGVTLSNAVTGTGNMVLSASPTLTGTISGANASLSGTLAVTGVATLTAQPILSSLTASRAVFTDGSKGLVSNAITGTGNVVMSASPTLTGTISAEALTTSSTVTLNGGTANGVAYLNGSKVLTSGSALTFDGTNFLVGVASLTPPSVGTTAPWANVSNGNNGALLLGPAASGTAFWHDNGGDTVTTIRNLYASTSANAQLRLQAGFLTFHAGTAVSEQMRLTSTGLGIGNSSPTAKLDVTGTAAISGAVTLSGGTANGVAYLNGSKVLTTGSALTFDGTTLKTQANFLAWSGGSAVSAKVGVDNGTSDSGLYYGADGSLDLRSRTSYPLLLSAIGSTYTAFAINGSEQMRLTSTGLGIGTSSPNYVATLYKASLPVLQLANSTSGSTAADGLLIYLNGANATISNEEAGSIGFQTSGTLRATLDSSGNLGLGVTPSAWNANAAAIDMRGFPAISGASSIELDVNAFKNASNQYIYKANGAASQYGQFNGGHTWSTAASGTAGNAISFTQAMTLDASGNLGVGTTSPNERLHIFKSTYPIFKIESSAYNGTMGIDTANGNLVITNTSNAALVLSTNATERARITSGGYFKASNNGTYGAVSASFHEFNQSASDQGVVVLYGNNASTTAAGMLFIETARNTTNNTYYAISYYNSGAAAYKFRVADSGDVTNANNSYGAISDVKLKENVTDATPKLEKLQQVRVVNYNLIGEDQKQLGVIAQELEQIFPGMVDESPDRDKDGNDLGTTTKSVKYSVFVPMLIKAMQEQQAIIESLRQRLAAAGI